MAEIKWNNISDAGANSAISNLQKGISEQAKNREAFGSVFTDLIDTAERRELAAEKEAKERNAQMMINQMNQASSLEELQAMQSQLNEQLGMFGSNIDLGKYNTARKSWETDTQIRNKALDDLKDTTETSKQLQVQVETLRKAGKYAEAEQLIAQNSSHLSTKTQQDLLKSLRAAEIEDREYALKAALNEAQTAHYNAQTNRTNTLLPHEVNKMQLDAEQTRAQTENARVTAAKASQEFSLQRQEKLAATSAQLSKVEDKLNKLQNDPTGANYRAILGEERDKFIHSDAFYQATFSVHPTIVEQLKLNIKNGDYDAVKEILNKTEEAYIDQKTKGVISELVTKHQYAENNLESNLAGEVKSLRDTYDLLEKAGLTVSSSSTNSASTKVGQQNTSKKEIKNTNKIQPASENTQVNSSNGISSNTNTTNSQVTYQTASGDIRTIKLAKSKEQVSQIETNPEVSQQINELVSEGVSKEQAQKTVVLSVLNPELSKEDALSVAKSLPDLVEAVENNVPKTENAVEKVTKDVVNATNQTKQPIQTNAQNDSSFTVNQKLEQEKNAKVREQIAQREAEAKAKREAEEAKKQKTKTESLAKPEAFQEFMDEVSTSHISSKDSVDTGDLEAQTFFNENLDKYTDTSEQGKKYISPNKINNRINDINNELDKLKEKGTRENLAKRDQLMKERTLLVSLKQSNLKGVTDLSVVDTAKSIGEATVYTQQLGSLGAKIEPDTLKEVLPAIKKSVDGSGTLFTSVSAKSNTDTMKLLNQTDGLVVDSDLINYFQEATRLKTALQNSSVNFPKEVDLFLGALESEIIKIAKDMHKNADKNSKGDAKYDNNIELKTLVTLARNTMKALGNGSSKSSIDSVNTVVSNLRETYNGVSKYITTATALHALTDSNLESKDATSLAKHMVQRVNNTGHNSKARLANTPQIKGLERNIDSLVSENKVLNDASNIADNLTKVEQLNMKLQSLGDSDMEEVKETMQQIKEIQDTTVSNITPEQRETYVKEYHEAMQTIEKYEKEIAGIRSNIEQYGSIEMKEVKRWEFLDNMNKKLKEKRSKLDKIARFLGIKN